MFPRLLGSRPKWIEFALALCTVVGTSVTVFAYFAVRGPEKALEVRILQSDRLASPDFGNVKQLEILFDKQRVAQPTRVVGEVVSTGRNSIRREDVESPLAISMGEGKILAAGIVSSEPAGIDAKISTDQSSIVLRHGLMNSGDRVTFEILFDGASIVPSASARIAGVSEVLVVQSYRPNKSQDVTWPVLPKWSQWAASAYVLLVSAGMMAALVGALRKQFHAKASRIHDEAFRIVNPSDILSDMSTVATDPNVVAVLAAIWPFVRLEWLQSAETFSKAIKDDARMNWDPGNIDRRCRQVFEYLQVTLPLAIQSRIRHHPRLSADKALSHWANSQLPLDSQFKSPHDLLADGYREVHAALSRIGFGRPKAGEVAGIIAAWLLFTGLTLPFLFLSMGALRALWIR